MHSADTIEAVEAIEAIDPDWYRGRRVMVTGARGFLGRYVCRQLAASGADVIPLGRADGDLCEQADVRRLLAARRPRAVIHLAAACGGIGANVERPGEFLYANALMGLMLLEESRRAAVEVFTLISTTCAYPEHAPMPLQEDTFWDGPPTHATGAYGLAKRLLHAAIVRYREQYDFEGITLVPANLYGPGDHIDPARSHVVPALIRRFCEAADRGAPEVINWGTGRPTREFLHARDAARAIALATARHRDPRPVNLGTGAEVAIAELSRLIADAAGFRGAIRWDATKPDGAPRRVLDVERARVFGFEARIPLADGIRETVAWHRGLDTIERGADG